METRSRRYPRWNNDSNANEYNNVRQMEEPPGQYSALACV
jgi:hypothetical protein